MSHLSKLLEILNNKSHQTSYKTGGIFSTSNFYTWSIPEMNSAYQANFNGGLHFSGGQLVGPRGATIFLPQQQCALRS
jgi:hypothetical protein